MSVRFHNEQTIPRRGSGGFTLIEILVVLVIVGILIAVSLLSFGIAGGNQSLQRDARRLVTIIESVTDEATIQGRDYGLEFMQNGYRFLEHDPLIDQWFEVEDDDLLRPRTLDDAAEIELTIEEHRVLLKPEAKKTTKTEDDDRDLTDDYLPHVLILSSGDVTPFQLRIVRPADRAYVAVELGLDGELEILRDDQES